MQSCLYEFLGGKNSCEIFVVLNDKQSFLASQVALFLGYETFVLPELRASFGDDLRSFSDEFSELLSSLHNFYECKNSKKLLISPLKTLTLPLPNESLLKHSSVEFGESLELKSLKQKLLFWGYTFVDVVETKGEVSFRGDIIDIYPPNLENPIRISLFDDEVESIRSFSAQSQKSDKEELESFVYLPAFFALDEDAYDELNQNIQKLQSDAFVKDVASLGLWVLSLEQRKEFLKGDGVFLSAGLESEIKELCLFDECLDEQFLLSLPLIPDASSYKDAVVSGNVSEYISFHQGKKIRVLANNEALLKSFELDAMDVEFVKSPLVLNFLSPNELILSLNSPYKKKKKRKKASIMLDELKLNDYVVHESYGIGVFKGLTNTTVLGVTKDFVLIEYQGDDKLLLPVENLDVIDKYLGESGSLAVVDRLGKGSFLKLKQKAKAKLFEIAGQIVSMAAKRELIEGKSIDIDRKILHDFWLSSGFVYTKDQERAVEDILSDLKSSNVMDRLLSADVGFGKTEVAMNAILACVKSSYQALFIAPTTLLSSQHFKTLDARLSPFGVRIRRVDRFTSAKEKKSFFEDFSNGKLDVLVGTHALLGVQAKSLALLVIDEEHKFGVKQKEKLKELSSNLHLLSMSATPIPRSLNMALSSIKGYSQILTPPSEREDVRSFVKEYDEGLLKEIVLRELRRNGQIFYVHNRIASIEQKAKELRALLPKLRILVLHSQVSASESEKQMLAFEEGKYDMLLSTSIIESGIHLPNVNTIIIENSERFGMADLHQLRGRVGRGKRQGYCYFLVENKESLSEGAKKRLLALEANSFLGSGSVLAYHDLEIRGGGNLVGEAQSGHIKNIGYSLYLKMLEDAINTLLNKEVIKKTDVDLKLSVNAFLSDTLIAEDRVRLELYRRLSKCESVNDVYDIEGEIEDRFGKIDENTRAFLQMITVKILASKANVKSISNYAQNITITHIDESKTTLKARSKDDDDILTSLLEHFRKELKK